MTAPAPAKYPGFGRLRLRNPAGRWCIGILAAVRILAGGVRILAGGVRILAGGVRIPKSRSFSSGPANVRELVAEKPTLPMVF